MVFAGIALGVATSMFGQFYYQDRFREQLKHRLFITVLCAVICAGVVYANMICGTDIGAQLSAAVLCSSLIIIGAIDKEKMIIPNEIVGFLAIFRCVIIALTIVKGEGDLKEVVTNYVGAAALGCGVFLLARLVSPSSIGFGDIKLFAVIGLYMGARGILPAVFCSLVFALIFTVAKLIRKQITARDCFGFGPYIAMGTIFTMVIGG